MKKLFFALTILLLLPNYISAQSKTEQQNIFSKSYNYVNDFEKILTEKQIETLNTTLKTFEKKALYKIVIVSVPSIKPYDSFPEYAHGLDQYLASDPKLDPTILIVVSKTLRQIQVLSIDLIRYKLSDDETQSILTNFTIPEFKKGDYYQGLENAVTQIIDKMK
ncbi:uncharacterized protein BD847_2597 [Flavobacterium cutihirudinis]|uniref:TPM domain-containing protein n=1 Tax=Flavobacterium cutihirudinis TaxID=1265740 RepID=A0A3D9FUC8_9FLAO|nr:TPM domain-containing protein [Flavobacterium cutihirudinis]RED23539.1 uncharacterized protein BD847_2597 [Flavobacterium cutihirudinis]